MFFKKPLEIRSKAGVLHFERWEIFSIPKTNIHLYLHKISNRDLDAHQHDHPWDFFSLILKGGYAEKIGEKYSYRGPFSLAHRKATDTHKIMFLSQFRPVWTLVLTHGEKREWGYKTQKYGCIPHYTYRKYKHEGKL